PCLSDSHLRVLHSFPTRRSSDLDVPSEQTILERPARVKYPLEPFALEELVLLFELGVVPLVSAFARCVEPAAKVPVQVGGLDEEDRKSTRLNSSHLGISYAVFCL